MTNIRPCPHGCVDGFILRYDLPEYPRGLAYPCKCRLTEIEKQKYKMLIRAARIDGAEHMTFENYKPQNETQSAALAAITAKHGSFFVFGPWGTGKTHLITATVFRAIDHGIPAVSISLPALLKDMRKIGRSDAADIEKLAQEIPYLCIDDFGKQRDTDWTEERLFELIDARYRSFVGGLTFTSFTSNQPIPLLAERIDGAIIDRIQGMCTPIKVLGESYRMKRKGDLNEGRRG